MPPRLIFGAGGIGGTAAYFTYTWDTAAKLSDDLLATLDKVGISELDGAAAYPPGNPWNAETLLGESGAAGRGFVIDSKIMPLRDGGKTLGAENLAYSLDRSLELLRADKVRIMYAHGPDPLTPLAEQAENFDRLLATGKIEKFGLCNYSFDDMTEYFRICDEKGYAKPSVYQGCYNALYREPEKKLLALIRKHNCAFYAFSPLAGGFLTGKVTFASDADLNRTRWKGDSAMGAYVNVFDTPVMHEAIRKLDAACKAAEPPLSLQEASLRWLVHHSGLQDGDAIILGAKRTHQLESNVEDARRGPLGDDVSKAVDALWASVDGGKEIVF